MVAKKTTTKEESVDNKWVINKSENGAGGIPDAAVCSYAPFDDTNSLAIAVLKRGPPIRGQQGIGCRQLQIRRAKLWIQAYGLLKLAHRLFEIVVVAASIKRVRASQVALIGLEI